MSRYQKDKIEEIPAAEKIANWLGNQLPTEQKPILIHNDFKMNNVLFSENSQEVNAILDWEMATIGDSLFDLGAALSYWFEESDPELLKSSLLMPTAQIGFISRREFLHLYSVKTNRDVSDFPFYLVLAYFKIAVAVQQIYYRYATGQTNDERFANSYQSAINLMTYAELLIEDNVL